MSPTKIKLVAGAVIALAAYLESAKVVPPGLSALLGGALSYALGWAHPTPGGPKA